MFVNSTDVKNIQEYNLMGGKKAYKMYCHISLWYLPRPIKLLIMTPAPEILINFTKWTLLLSFESWRSSHGLQFLKNFYFSHFFPPFPFFVSFVTYLISSFIVSFLLLLILRFFLPSPLFSNISCYDKFIRICIP
jgi:hypothetical protein